jgi:predicted kinase
MKLQVLVGMIASGKSTYARQAARHGVLCVNDDAIVNLIHADQYDLYDPKIKALYKSIENHIVGTCLALGRNVLIDRGLNVSPKARQRWIALARSFDARCEALVFANEGPQAHAERRFQSDSRGCSLEFWMKAARRHDSLFVPPTLEEGFEAVYLISFSDIQQGRVIL